MNKILLIIQREYLTRVKKKSFIIMTFVGPILFTTILSLPFFLAQIESEESKKVAVIDSTGEYFSQLQNAEQVEFTEWKDVSVENAKRAYRDAGYYAVLIIKEDPVTNPRDAVELFSHKAITMDVKNQVERNLESYIRDKKIAALEIENMQQILNDLDQNITVNTIKWGESGEAKKSSTEVTMIIAMVSGLLIYMFIFIYGAQVLRGVMEEKTNRIVEVLISSVKPFQLMMGKIVGIAMVGLTQFLLWVILTMTISTGIQLAFSGGQDDAMSQMAQTEQLMNMDGATNEQSGVNPVTQFLDPLSALNFKRIVLGFLFYFLGGYLLYSAMFAAIGAAVDNETDTQQFMLPITIPLMFSLYVVISSFQNPDGPLAYWCSLIPFTSPTVMMMRLIYDVPTTDLIISMALLVISFVGMTWVAAKIYRTGILMYGKKASYKELWKWLRYHN